VRIAYSDRLKEEIRRLNIVFAISIATDISLIAWLIENFRTSDPFLLLIGGLGTLRIERSETSDEIFNPFQTTAETPGAEPYEKSDYVCNHLGQ